MRILQLIAIGLLIPSSFLYSQVNKLEADLIISSEIPATVDEWDDNWNSINLTVNNRTNQTFTVKAILTVKDESEILVETDEATAVEIEITPGTNLYPANYIAYDYAIKAQQKLKGKLTAGTYYFEIKLVMKDKSLDITSNVSRKKIQLDVAEDGQLKVTPIVEEEVTDDGEDTEDKVSSVNVILNLGEEAVDANKIPEKPSEY